MLDSAFALLLHQAPAQYPARAARLWIPPSIPPAPVDPAQYPAGAARQWSCSPVDPADYPTKAVDPAEYPARAACQWIPQSITPERLASGSRQVSHQSGWILIPPSRVPRGSRRESRPPEQPASGSRQISRKVSQSSPPVDPAEYPLPVDPAEYPASIKPERLASIRQ